MTNQRENQNQQNSNSIAEGLKNTAGSAFETVHNALEATENVAMKAVDATSNAVNSVTGNNNNDNRDNQE